VVPLSLVNMEVCQEGQKKKGCQWLLVSHKQVTLDEVVSMPRDL